MGIDAKQVEKEADEITSILEDIHKDPFGRAREFAELMEGRESIEKTLGISDMYTINYGAVRRKYNKFCLAYLIKVFINFTSDDDDMEILLVGYERIDWGNDCNDTVPENWDNYWEYAHKSNKRLIGRKGKDKAHIGREVEDNVMEELSKTLAEIKLKSTDNKLGYIDKVLKDFEDIPEKLTLPVPEWLRDDRQDIKTGGGKPSWRFKFPNGGIIEIFGGSESKEAIEAIERIAKIVATAAPIIAIIVFSGLLDRKIGDYRSRERQKEAGFTASIQLEDTDKDRKNKIEGEISEFEPLPSGTNMYDLDVSDEWDND